ncbi:Starch-binding associating with outer membrane [Pustulibacterium marinum]|uniref:Starch-binding associating with outer membrane n=1 Tax=Pustulibacterium marinum TaxID=1224947 RepID=A0A1I7F608_9FLAO|nr:SusD/RagB family nutrient-binding outer membrane lipoprotein [Pustulibacterium marinum]SFU31622.1 Starch-binding associating with outer membrane [Pustulibacterium marinum]
MKNIKLKVTLFLSLILATSACSDVDYGDTNVNPYAAQTGEPDALLRGAIVNYFDATGRDYLTRPTLYVQYLSQTQYTDEQRYNEAPADWSSYYTLTLESLKQVANTTEDLRGTTENMNATAEILSVLVWKRVTDTFGDIPYFEALQTPAILNPAFTPQEEIYTDLIERAKAARDMFTESSTSFTLDPSTDIIYDGDIDMWRKFANSLILGLTIQLSNQYPSAGGYAATEFSAALNNPYGVLESTSEDAVFTPDVSGGVVNPYSQLRVADYRLSQELTDALKGNDDSSLNPTSNRTLDERLYIFSDTPSGDGLPYGYATYSSYTDASHIQNWIRLGYSPAPIYTSSYTYLNRAEAAALGWTSEDAEAMLSAGIQASFDYWEDYQQVAVDNDDTFSSEDVIELNADDYIAARIVDATTVGIEQVIGEEKWISLFLSGFDAWAEQRRTGYPELTPSSAPFNNGTIPERLVYPTESSSVNTANYDVGVSGLSPATDLNSSSVWWNQ